MDVVLEARDILAEAVEIYRPRRVFGLFSGGYDSLCACHIASQHPEFAGCIHINTGIGIEGTRHFVRRTCRRFGWPLKEYHPPVSYEELVLRWGFPGPAGHTLMYNRLKERCLRQLVREHKQTRTDHILLVTGVRRHESRRRMGHIVPLQKEGARIWAAPLVNWLPNDKREYMAAHGLPLNSIVEALCMSGECLCGAFAKPGEIRQIEVVAPRTAEQIHELEAKARKAGVHCVWGTRPPRGKRREKLRGLTLCHSCVAKSEAGDKVA